MERAAAHPYFPPSASIPGYEPNTSSAPSLVGALGIAAGALVLGAYRCAVASGLCARSLDRFAAAWFALCGFLHIAFEGYYIVHRRRIAGLQTIPAQLWKEYALSDSRYLTSDTFTVCVETITVLVWGPLCLLAFASTVRRHRLRHALQVVVCTAHLYGCALYYATNWVEHLATGVSYSRPEWLYYWLYYVGFNLPWILVPLVLLYDSFAQIGRAFALLHAERPRSKCE